MCVHNLLDYTTDTKHSHSSTKQFQIPPKIKPGGRLILMMQLSHIRDQISTPVSELKKNLCNLHQTYKSNFYPFNQRSFWGRSWCFSLSNHFWEIALEMIISAYCKIFEANMDIDRNFCIAYYDTHHIRHLEVTTSWFEQFLHLFFYTSVSSSFQCPP